jgi:hypothetical protein
MSTVDEQPPRAPGARARRRRRRRLLWFLLILLVGSSVLSYVAFRFILPSVPRQLVGTWEVVDGDLKGATLEFTWYGTGSATMFKDGKKEVAESSVRVRGKRIYMTYQNTKILGGEETVIQTIVKLTDDELIIRDQDEVVYHLVKIRD